MRWCVFLKKQAIFLISLSLFFFSLISISLGQERSSSNSEPDDKKLENFKNRFVDKFEKLSKKLSERHNENREGAHKGWNELLGVAGLELDKVTKQEDVALFLFEELGVANQGGTIGLYDNTFDAPSVLSDLPITAGISMNLHRSVVDKNNVRGTYGVIDKITLRLAPSAYLKLTGIPGLAGSVGGGPRFSFEVINIRQVTPEEYSRILPIKSIKKQFSKIIKKKKAAPKIKIKGPANTVREKTNERYLNFMPKLSKYMPEKNAVREAYLGRLWNPISQVFRLPVTKKSIKRMEDNEIISYALNGGVVLGASFGTGLDPTGYLTILQVHGADLNFSVNGKHQISVLKEAPQKKGDNFVRVKLTRVRDTGVTYGMGSSQVTALHKWLTLDGHIVWTTVGGVVQLKPYRFQLSKKNSNFYDVAYRFNLNIEQGKEAYIMASRGDFTLADVYSKEEYFKMIGRNEKKRPVKKLFTKKQKVKSRNIEQMVSLFLLNLKKSRTFNDSDKWIKIDSDIHKYFETDVMSSRAVKILFAFNKNRSHRFTVNADLNKFDQRNKPDDSLTLLVRASYQDDFIPAGRYVRYVDEIEMALDKNDFLPLPPLEKGMKKFAKGTVGKIKLNYSLKIKRKAIEKLINYPESKMWPALINAFGAKGKGWEKKVGRAKYIAARLAVYGLTIPVSALGARLPEKDDIIVAKIKYSRWKKLKEFINEPKKLSRALGKFFDSGDYGPEMVKLLRNVLVGEKISMAGKFKSDLLGKEVTVSEGKTAAWKDPTATHISRSFDSYRPNFKGIQSSGLTANVIGQSYFKVNFNLEKIPKKVFFKLESKNITGALTNKTLKVLVVDNEKERFKKGLNSFVFFLNDKQHFLYPVAEKIKFYKLGFFGNKYRLSVAGSEDGIHFGDLSRVYFRAKPVYHKTKLKTLKKWSEGRTKDCLGKSADELIFYLDKNKIEDHKICFKQSRRHWDGRCKIGVTPYVKIIGMKKKNMKNRNEWIIENCPRVLDKEDLNKLLNEKDICRGKKANEIIKDIGKNIFYICDYWNKKGPKDKGFCKDGVIPYLFDDLKRKKHADNIKSRNDWLKKTCN